MYNSKTMADHTGKVEFKALQA